MESDVRPIIEEIASQTDDFLHGVSDRAQARAGISDFITLDFVDLTPAQRANVIAGVMAVLESEDFFGMEFVGDPFADESTPDTDEA